MALKNEPEWIRWEGQECPVARSDTVELRLDTSEVLTESEPETWCWDSKQNLVRNIVAYRNLSEFMRKTNNHKGDSMPSQNTTWALVKIAQHQSALSTESPYLVRFVGDGYDAPAIAKWLVLHHLPHNQLLWYPDEQAAWSGDVKVEECNYQELVEAEAAVLRKYLPCVTLTKGHLKWLKLFRGS